MGFASKYPGKCKVCATTWAVGDHITRVGDGHWCKSQECAAGKTGAAPSVTPEVKQAQDITSVRNKLMEMHTLAWGIADQESQKYEADPTGRKILTSDDL